jgi:hypothetical protein
MDGKRCSPEVEDEIDVPSRHLIATIQKVRNFKFETIIVWCPVVRTSIRSTWRRRSIGWYVVAVLVADLPYTVSNS